MSKGLTSLADVPFALSPVIDVKSWFGVSGLENGICAANRSPALLSGRTEDRRPQGVVSSGGSLGVSSLSASDGDGNARASVMHTSQDSVTNWPVVSVVGEMTT